MDQLFNKNNLDTLNKESIIKILINFNNFIEIHGYDHDIKINEFIEKFRKVKKSVSKTWDKEVARFFGSILKKLNKLKKNKEVLDSEKKDLIYKIDFEKSYYPPIFEKHLNILNNIKIKKISMGNNHIGIIDDNNQLCLLGYNNFGQLGIDSDDEINQFYHHNQFSNCSYIYCGYAFTCVISENKLYTFGAGENGRLGNNSTDSTYIPQLINFEEDIIPDKISGGSTFVNLLTKKGQIYTWGDYRYNGHMLDEDLLVPKHLNCFEGIQFHSVSSQFGYHTIALAKNGKVYAWGHNRVGQLGNCDHAYVQNNTDYDTDCDTDDGVINVKPKIISQFSRINIKKIIASWGHSVALDYKGNVYVAGRNYEGQLGIPKEICKVNSRNHQFMAPFLKLDYLNIESIFLHSVSTLLKRRDNYTIFRNNEKITISTDDVKDIILLKDDYYIILI